MKKSKDAQRIIVAFYLRKRRQREHLRIIKSDDCCYPDYIKYKQNPELWREILNRQHDILVDYHNSLEVAKRALWGNWD